MVLKDLKNKKIKFFLLQSKYTEMFLFKEFSFWYLLNLLIDRLWFLLKNIEVEIVFPFNKYLDNFYNRLPSFKEDVFVFYLENYYYGNNYWYNFVIDVLEKLKDYDCPPDVYIYTLKTESKESLYFLEKYKFVKIVIRNDIEYFFNEYFFKNVDLKDIPNIIVQENWNIFETKKENITYDLGDYILWWHYSWYLNKFKLSKDYIINLLDEDDWWTDKILTHILPKDKKIANFRYLFDVDAMISTWRGCLYNFSYCYRWIKYSKIRQVPLDIVKKDLDYLKEMYYRSVYLYDDCFLTSNWDRLDSLLELLSNYDFFYWISIRYEMCNSDIFTKLQQIKLYSVQIVLQSISMDSNKTTWSWLDLIKFKDLVLQFRNKWTIVSIDIILWLPWEKLKDFLKTVTFAASLDPWSIHINTLFLNPWTKLSLEQEKYWIKTNVKEKWIFSVPKLLSSDTFSEKDIELARIYVGKLMIKYPNTKIILR